MVGWGKGWAVSCAFFIFFLWVWDGCRKSHRDAGGKWHRLFFLIRFDKEDSIIDNQSFDRAMAEQSAEDSSTDTLRPHSTYRVKHPREPPSSQLHSPPQKKKKEREREREKGTTQKTKTGQTKASDLDAATLIQHKPQPPTAPPFFE